MKSYMFPLQTFDTTAAHTRPYRIALIHPTAGIASSGSQLSAIDMAKHLSTYFEVELLSGADCGPFSYPIWSVPRTSSSQFFQQPWLKLLLKGKVSHPDIVLEHVTSFFPCMHRLLSSSADLIYPNNSYGGLAVAALIRNLKGTPFIYTEREGGLSENKCLIRDLRFKPNHLVVFNNSVADAARSIRPCQHMSVIPNGVDLSRFSPQGRSVDIQLSSPIVLCVASLNRSNHKQIELVIRAVSKLKEPSLLICGKGADAPYFQALGNDLIGCDRFQICSFPFEKMPEVYRCANLFTLPSKDEPFGRVYIEAMASGLPVVAPDDEGRRMIIGNSGLFCDVTDVEAYAASIQNALSQVWGDLPRQQSLKFSWEKVALLYKDVIVDTIQASVNKE